MIHTAKTDWWIASAIAINVIALLLGASYWLGVPVLVVLFLCAYPQSYQTTCEGLLVRAALTRTLIPYRVITSVDPAPRGCVRIRYGLAGKLVIAPANREMFLADVAKRAPHLVRRGHALVLRYA